MTKSLTVVGGGMIGLCTAYYAAEAGLEVTILEKSSLGSGAARGNAGIISELLVEPVPGPGAIREVLASLRDPHHAVHLRPKALPQLTPFFLRAIPATARRRATKNIRVLRAYSRVSSTLFSELAQAGRVVQLSSNPLIAPFINRDTAKKHLDHLHDSSPDHPQLPKAILTGDEMRELVPNLSEHVTAGLRLDTDHYIDPRTFVDAMIRSLRKRKKVHIYEEVEDIRFRVNGWRVSGVIADGEVIDSDEVLLCCGASTPELGRQLALRIPVAAGYGYNFVVKPEPQVEFAMLFPEHHFACTPLPEGLRVGGTMDFAGRNAPFDSRRIDGIVDSAERYFSGIDWSARGGEWYGARPMCADAKPIIGRVGRYKNLLLATGHGMWGLKLGPATGKSITEIVTDGYSPSLPDEFSPRRFRSLR